MKEKVPHYKGLVLVLVLCGCRVTFSYPVLPLDHHCKPKVEVQMYSAIILNLSIDQYVMITSHVNIGGI